MSYYYISKKLPSVFLFIVYVHAGISIEDYTILATNAAIRMARTQLSSYTLRLLIEINIIHIGTY